MKRSTWVLLVLVLGALAVILLWEKDRPGTAEREEKALALFREFPETSAFTRIERTGEHPVLLVREGEGWRLEAPVADSGDRFSVEGFLDRIREARAERFLEESVPLEDLGLESPALSWRLWAGESEWTVSLGTEAPLDAGVYVRAGGRPALVSSSLKETLRRDAAEFRARDLVPLEPGKVREFKLEGEQGPLFSASRLPGGWRILEPFADYGDRWRVDGYLDNWCLASVERFLEAPEEGLGALGLDPPRRILTLVDGEGRSLAVRVGGPLPEESGSLAVLVEGRPSPMAVSGRIREALEPDPETFRSMDLFLHPSYDAVEVAVSGGHSEQMKRDGRGLWVFSKDSASPEGKDAAPVAESLLGLRGTLAVPAADLKSLGLAPPFLTVAVTGEGFEERLAVGIERDGRRYARPAGRPVALLLDPEAWARAEAALRAVPEPLPEGIPEPEPEAP